MSFASALNNPAIKPLASKVMSDDNEKPGTMAAPQNESPLAPRQGGNAPAAPGGGTAKPNGLVGQHARPADQVQPVTRELDQQNDTVQGRMEGLLDKNSKYIQQARGEAQRHANKRGLVNSTMAAAAGEEAAIKAALPIAQQDAQTSYDQGKSNQAAENRFLENRQSTDLNKELERVRAQIDMDKEAHNYKLKEHLEMVVADKKLSNDMKLSYAQETSRIMTESQTQIGQIGTSDRTPAQQEAAINQVIKQRDSQIVLLKDLMQKSQQWEWF